MAKKTLYDVVAANNGTAAAAAGIEWPEGMARAQVNNSARAMMAVEKAWLLDNQALTTAGTSTAYSVTTNQSMATPADGDTLSIRLDEDCGATPTLAVDGGTARTIVHSDGSAIAAGDLKANATYNIVYRLTGTQWWISGSGNQTATFDARYDARHGDYAGMISNLELAASVASNILTVAVKTAAGTDATAADSIIMVFPSATEASGATTRRTLSAASSVAVPDTATMGTANNTSFRYWVVMFDDAGTLRLGVINCRDSTNNIFALGGWGRASSTTIGTGSDSAHVFYTGTGVTSMPYITLGYVEYDASGLATAGTYASAPDRIRLHYRGMHLPGDVVQRKVATYVTSADLTTQIPTDDTVPQNTEGTSVISYAMTNDSPANVVRLKCSGMGCLTTGASAMTIALFTSASASAIYAVAATLASGVAGIFAAEIAHFPNSAAAVTYSMRAGPGTATTLRLNGTNTARLFGGVAATYLWVEELMS